MTEQLSLFDALGVEIFDARIHEEAVKESKRESIKKAAAVKLDAPKVEPKEEVKKIIDRTLAPTWRVDLFDKEKAQRFAWYRCEDEVEAKLKATKEYGTSVIILEVRESEYTLEEIEAMY